MSALSLAFVSWMAFRTFRAVWALSKGADERVKFETRHGDTFSVAQFRLISLGTEVVCGVLGAVGAISAVGFVHAVWRSFQ